MRYFSITTALLWASSSLYSVLAANEDFDFYRRQHEARQRSVAEAQTREILSARKTGYRYHTAKTAPYAIESWPDVDFDTGEFVKPMV
jgi:hypothetical protein